MKIYRTGSNIVSYWILPNGDIRNIGGELHTSFFYENYKLFNISDKEIGGRSYYDIIEREIYCLAFSKGAIRIVTINSNREFSIECSVDGLRLNISNIHKLYKLSNKDDRGMVIYLNIVDIDNLGNSFGDINETLEGIDELYKYAGNKSIIKVSENRMDKEEIRLIKDLVKRIREGYSDWDDEDKQLYINHAKVIESLLRGGYIEGLDKE